MRLLKHTSDGEFTWTKDLIGDDDIPPYAILSHTWEVGEEVTFEDLIYHTGRSKAGYNKIRFCARQAEEASLQYFWVDTCCINKADHVELQDAINSMFGWYERSSECYVYLSDVSTAGTSTSTWQSAFRQSRWFTRGWTLQELLAPMTVKFFSREGQLLGDKTSLQHQVYTATGILMPALRGLPLHNFAVSERLSWMEARQTSRKEDKAYSLLGIFGIFMVLNYGEGEENALKRLKKEIKESSGDMILSLDEQQKQILLDSLRFDQIDARQLSIRNAHTKTCKWLLTKPEYHRWVNAVDLEEHHGFLWIKGKPGTGKSTLMKFALANSRQQAVRGRAAISFFFNARGGNMEKSTIGMYRSLLLQLLERIPSLQCVFDSLGLSTLSISRKQPWSVESLKSLLEQAVQSLEKSSVMCFIDALDECDEEQIRDMVSFFEGVGELAVVNNVGFHVCFSSRHYPHITIRKALHLVLEEQDGHSQDITTYLKSELRIGESNIAQQIRADVRDKASGIFMWVVLVVGILNKEHDRGRIHALRRRLEELPKDLHGLFRDILTRNVRDREDLVLCIQWVLFASQPLSPKQLYFAILSGVEYDPAELDEVLRWDSDMITDEVIKRFILDCSKGFTEITTSVQQKVQFIHESVRDFLLKENGLGKVWPEFANNFQAQSNERLKQCCFNYMNVGILAKVVVTGIHPKPRWDLFPMSLQCEAYPFLKYALRNVLYHADAAGGGGIDQAHFLRTFPLRDWAKLNDQFETQSGQRHSETVSLLYIMAESGMSNLIRPFSIASKCLEVENERYGCPLFAAMATGSDEAVKVIIESLAGDRFIESQYQWVGEYKQSCIGLGFTFSRNRTTLSYAAEFGFKQVVAFLLAEGKVDIDAKDEDGRTPLWWAAQNGQEDVIKLLLGTNRVDVESKDKNGWTLLSWAAYNGCEGIARLLLNTGKVDIDSKDNNGRTPLSWAVEGGKLAVIKLLLETGAVDVGVRDHSGATLLAIALAQRGE